MTCPNCGGKAERETDVSDNFLDSSWYFLRYPSTEFNDRPFDKELTEKWLPVNQYTGGMEHAVLHLMYARFITMALHDMGYFSFEEPFIKLNKNGMIIKDGRKMSKSVGNVINPDEYISKYGADAWRFYMFFIGPFDQGGDFSDKGITAMYKFINRVYAILEEVKGDGKGVDSLSIMHKTIKKVGDDIETISGFNTAIAAIMEFVNWIYKNKDEFNKNQKDEVIKNLILIIAPIAPFLSEEMWSEIGGDFSVHKQAWPKYDERQLQEDILVIAVQVNGKLRDTIEIPAGSTEDFVKEKAMQSEKVIKFLEAQEPKKIIYIKDKILSIVI